MTVNEMLARMTSEEVTEWMAYERLEPFGEVRQDLRVAMLCATLVNVNRASKDSPIAKVQDFMLEFDQEYVKAPEVASKAAESITKAVAAATGQGLIRTYEGEAPPIRKLGKRGRPPKKRKW